MSHGQAERVQISDLKYSYSEHNHLTNNYGLLSTYLTVGNRINTCEKCARYSVRIVFPFLKLLPIYQTFSWLFLTFYMNIWNIFHKLFVNSLWVNGGKSSLINDETFPLNKICKCSITRNQAKKITRALYELKIYLLRPSYYAHYSNKAPFWLDKTGCVFQFGISEDTYFSCYPP